MIRTADNSLNGRCNLQVFTLALLLGALSFVATANPIESQLTGVWNSSGTQRLNESQLQTLQVSLRQKTGFVQLGFDQQGALTLGNRQHIAGGSATARALLAAAVDSANRYELESHESSPDVAFARNYEAGNWKDSQTGKLIDVHRVQLDFADFSRLSGAREAKAAMDIGIALLHELVHAVLNLQDPQGDMNQIGECDAHINRIRRELRLAERLYYHPNITVARTSDGRRIISASLTFVERAKANAQPSAIYSLNWLPGQVSPNARNIAAFQQGLLVAKGR
jgi:hypothetical protein